MLAREVIDLHCHVLAGIDDGPQTVEGSLRAGARAAASRHARRSSPRRTSAGATATTRATIARWSGELGAAATAAGLRPKCSSAPRWQSTRSRARPRRGLPALRLGDGPWLLMECPFSVGADRAGADRQSSNGPAPRRARPPRALPGASRREPRAARSARRAAACSRRDHGGSLDRPLRRRVKRFALALVEAELVHNVASDAHDAEQRPPRIASRARRGPGYGELTRVADRGGPRGDARRRAADPAAPASPCTAHGCAAGGREWRRKARSGELRDRDDHPDQDEHDDRDLHPDPRWRHLPTAYSAAAGSGLRDDALSFLSGASTAMN